MSDAGPSARQLLPGAAALVGIAAVAFGVAVAIPGGNALVLAIVVGAVVGNLYGIPDRFEPGVGLHKLCLEIGIVLLGVRLAVDELLTAGPTVLALVLLTVIFGVLYAEALARFAFGLSGQTGSLLAAGSSVCGVSAIVAVAGAIRAREDAIAFTVATVVLFDAVTLVAFPVTGQLLGLSDRAFGVWAGLSMFSTGPVVAAGMAYSPVAGEWATITKLARNSLLGFVVVAYSLHYASRDGESAGASPSLARSVWDGLPKFVVGFAAVALLANAGVLSAGSIESITWLSDLLFVVAFAGLGLHLRLSDVRGTGLAPAALVSVYLLTVGTLTLLAVTALL